MADIRNVKARFKNEINKKWLENNHWYYSKLLSSDDDPVYTYRFTVFKYGTISTLDAEFTYHLNDNDVTVNVFDGGTRYIYAPFYCLEYGNYDSVMETINNCINKEIKRFNMELI